MTNLVHPSGAVVHMAGERLNLTDMWRGAGAPEGMRPDDWKKDAANRKFLDHISVVTNTPIEGIWKGTRGNGGATWAHWQIGLAYAKYLSPEWHAWCNSVVRERMEGKPAPVADELTRRLDGIARTTVHKVTAIEKVVTLMAHALEERDREIGELTDIVKGLVKCVDPRIGAVRHVPALQVAVDAGVQPKGRRKLVRTITSRLSRYCEPRGLAVLRDVRGTRLYPVEAVTGWMADEGTSLIRKHKAAVAEPTPLFRTIPGGKV